MRRLHNILSFLSGPKLPSEPERIKDSGIKTFNVDAMLRKLSDPYDPAYLSPERQKEQLPYGEWRCEYCAHVNVAGMLDCHTCGAPK
jgi:hypothetical protein